MATTKLQSSDKQIFEVEIEALNMSDTLRHLLEELGESASAETIPLPDVDGATLARAISFLRHHATEPPCKIEKPLRCRIEHSPVSEWDKAFINVDDDTLHKDILAANYLNIKPMLELMCAKIASMLQGKTTQEIRQRLNITVSDEYTPEEQAMKKDCTWATASL